MAVSAPTGAGVHPEDEPGPGEEDPGPRRPARASDPADDATPTPFEPVGVVPRYPPPHARVDPDRSLGWLRRMAPVVGAHRVLAAVSLAAALVAMVTTVAVPAVGRQAIDAALVDRTSSLAPFVVALGVLAVVRAVSAFGYRYGLFRLALLIEADLRSLLFEHLTRLSFSFYDRVQSGQIISRANSDIRSVQLFFAFAPLMAITVLSFFLALAVMLVISVPLTIVAVLFLPGVYVVGLRLRNQVFPLSWITQARQAEVATIVEENVAGVRVVKGFAAERQQIDALARTATGLRWSNVVTADARARHTPLIENLPRLGLVAVLVVGGWMAIEGQVTVGTIVAFNAYILQLQTPFRLLGLFLLMQQRAAASAGRIYEVLDEQPRIVDRPGAVDLLDPEGRVAFEHVRFGYAATAPGEDDGPAGMEGPADTETPAGEDGPAGEDRAPDKDRGADEPGHGHEPGADHEPSRPAEGPRPTPAVLEDLTLTIEPGETVALVGRTGSGKSTVARLLPRFYDVDAGAVRVDGHDVRDLTVTSLRAQIGLVLDEPFLFSASVRDNIAYGRPDADDATVEAAARAAHAHEFIAALPDGYDTVIGERGYTLSGGQRQRVAIARTLVVDPRILVLDDATSAIDVQVEQEIHAALGALLGTRTTLIIAHRLSTIALADRVALLEGGRIVASGTHQHLLATEPRYAAVLARAEHDDRQARDGRGGSVDPHEPGATDGDEEVAPS